MNDEITVKEARGLCAGLLQFGNTNHIEAVRLLSLLEEATEQGAVNKDRVLLSDTCRSCGGEGVCLSCDRECEACAGKGKVVTGRSVDGLTEGQLLELLASVADTAETSYV